ncbi:proton-coupled zinc antiporter SLC30A1-like [Chrysemys picta bellii]|uniref:proton-coupled zinc antiporter SLC30A1-like n=1 Tax=Chrysemys picta bellii TaxID=8478 RepID=UPI000CE63A1F|nr:zinc transporter 1-like [Chrysemys picta bellii]
MGTRAHMGAGTVGVGMGPPRLPMRTGHQGWLAGRGLRGHQGWLTAQLCLAIGLFLAEVVASRVTGSLLALSCSLQTLGMVLALGVALLDGQLACGAHPDCRNTFGWVRARVAGTLVCGVFLTALCLALLPRALHRAGHPQVTERPLALVGVGAAGLLIHLARVRLDRQHHPARAKSPHSGHASTSREGAATGRYAQETQDLLGNRQPWLEDGCLPAEESGAWLALCLRLLAASLGPATVLLYSLAFHLLWPPCVEQVACLPPCTGMPCWPLGGPAPALAELGPCWLLYLDPGLCVVVVLALILLGAPSLRGSALVLLQAVPDHLDLWRLESHLRSTEGVAALHELHVWQLDSSYSLVATAHVWCLDTASYKAVARRIQQVFWEHGIHAATVQPEFGALQEPCCMAAGGGDGCMGGGEAPRKRHPSLPFSSPTVILEYETTV